MDGSAPTPTPTPDALTDNVPADAPRYCVRCQAEAPASSALGGGLCADCGERLRAMGYCAICESYWKLEPGEFCPKHDVELVDEAPSSEIPSVNEQGVAIELVTVSTFNHPNEANGPRIRLEAEGIPTFLQGEHIARNTLWQVATGGVKLQVPAPLAGAARVLLAQTWAAPKESADEDELEDAWEDLAPEPGIRRRAVMKLAIWWMLLGPLIVILVGLLIDSAFR